MKPPGSRIFLRLKPATDPLTLIGTDTPAKIRYYTPSPTIPLVQILQNPNPTNPSSIPAMEEAQRILLNSLQSSGISLSDEFSSIQNLNPSALVSICAQSLHLIDSSQQFPTSLPDSVTERFKICTEISSAVKNLGYRGDISFHQFLYPSEEDSCKLVRFLVERLSQTSEYGKITDKETVARVTEEEAKHSSSTEWTRKVDNAVVDLSFQTVDSSLKDLNLNTDIPESGSAAIEASISAPLNGQKADGLKSISRSVSSVSTSGDLWVVEDGVQGSEGSRRDASGNKEGTSQSKDLDVNALKQKLASLQEQSSKMKQKIEDQRSQDEMLKQELATKALESQRLEREHELSKAAVQMALDDQHPVDFYVEQLNKQVEAGRRNTTELKTNGNFSQSLEEKKRSFQEILHTQEQKVHTQEQKVQEKLPSVNEIELETEAVLSEIRKREEERSRLAAELEKQPKAPTRKSYIERITEITKNSRKQDADIERILKDTRQLQIESNSIQERLHRTYAVVDETMSRDVKKDPVRMQAYKLLTSIHESFEQISEKILATDRIRREVAEQEAKLASVATRNLDTDKLQVDLDAIRKENELLEQKLSHF